MPRRNSTCCSEKPSLLRRSPRLRISTKVPEPDEIIATVISPSLRSSSAPVMPISQRKSPSFSSPSGLAKSVRTIGLRRSPRFICRCDYSCPEPYPRMSPKIGGRSSGASTSAQDSPRYSLKECREKTKGELSNSNRGNGRPEDLSTGLRKSPRLNIRDDSFLSLRQSSRLSTLRNANGCGNQSAEFSKEAMVFNGAQKNPMRKHRRSGNNLEKSEKCEGNSQSLRKSQRIRRQCNTVDPCRGAISMKRDDTKGSQDVLKAQANMSTIQNSSTKSKRGKYDIDRKEAPVRRKRERDDVGIGLNQGWSIEQEAALQRAYYTAKPTPHFWKMVSKLVPGKSAQECFDKVHSNHLTPPQPRPRSRAKKMKISPLSISENELLRLDQQTRELNCSKRKNNCFVHKNIRRLLQKNFQVDQDCEIDLFSILEPELETEELQPNVVLSTPDNLKKKRLLQKCHSRSLGEKKPLSRLSISCSSDSVLVSPTVLKQVKNRVLHEKYIDQLHDREAKRKALTARVNKSTMEEGRKEERFPKVDVIRAAKHALVSDARDAMDHFKHLRETERSFSEDEEVKDGSYLGDEDDED